MKKFVVGSIAALVASSPVAVSTLRNDTQWLSAMTLLNDRSPGERATGAYSTKALLQADFPQSSFNNVLMNYESTAVDSHDPLPASYALPADVPQMDSLPYEYDGINISLPESGVYLTPSEKPSSQSTVSPPASAGPIAIFPVPSSVPEPSIWMMMLSSFIISAYFIRRQPKSNNEHLRHDL